MIDSRTVFDEAHPVPRVAHRIYDTQAFADLPILADAVEDAGCTDAALLDHLRRPTGHVRGCWALDLLRPAVEIGNRRA